MKPIKRILLGDEQASSITNLIEKLRQDSCKVDASKVVNEIIELFFNKYEPTEFRYLKEKFFNKKRYLKQLINSASSDNIDESIKQYLSQTRPVKKRGRKSKPSNISINNEEAASS